MKLLQLVSLAFCLNLTGCQLLNDDVIDQVSTGDAVETGSEFEQVFASIADQLLILDKFDYKNKAMAISTLVWTDTLVMKDPKHRHYLIGHQIADGLKVEFVQRGGKVIEHQSSSAISMTKHASYYLSRDLDELAKQIDIQYILAGTLLEVENGVMVHAQVIDIYSKEIVGSAKQYVPNHYMVSNNSVVFKNGRLHRNTNER